MGDSPLYTGQRAADQIEVLGVQVPSIARRRVYICNVRLFRVRDHAF